MAYLNSTTKNLPFLLWISLLSFALLYNIPLKAQKTDTLKQQFRSNPNDTFRIANDAIDKLITYSADDSIYFDIHKKTVYLFGNASVLYDGLDLKAAQIIVDFNKKEIMAKGRINDTSGLYVDKPVFNDGERQTKADSMRYNFNTKKGRTYGITLKEDDGYILCDKVFRDEDKSIYSNAGKYTTCNLPHPHFYLKARNLKIIPEKKVLFGPSNLIIEDVPTPLVLPFGMFPTKKGQKSGILAPEYGMSGAFGPFLRNLGYYFGINDNLDQTFYTDVYFRGSFRLASLTRYAKKYHYNGSFNLEFSRYISAEKEDLNYRSSIRTPASLKWFHAQDAKARPGTSFSANVNIQKENSARYNSTDPTQIVNNEFSSSVSYATGFLRNKINFNSNIQHRQNTQTKFFSLTLPSFTVSMQRIMPFAKPKKDGKQRWFKDFGISYLGSFDNRIQTLDSVFFTGLPFMDLWQGNTNLFEKDKFQQGITHSIPITLGSYKFFKQHFYFTPTVTYREYWYFKTIDKKFDIATNNLDTIYNHHFSRASDYSAAATIGTQIFGTFQLKNKRIAAIRHTITPTLGASYRPDFGLAKYGIYKNVITDTTLRNGKMQEQLYSKYEGGIVGGPSKSPAGLITLGITNMLQAKKLVKKDTSSKYENVTWIENISLNTSYNLLADSFQLSPIQLSGFTTIFKTIRFNSSATLNPYTKDGGGKQFEIVKNKRLGVFENANLDISTGLNADMFKKKKFMDTTGKSKEVKDALDAIRHDPNGYVNFSIPWSVNINYSINYFRARTQNPYVQTFSLNGDFNLTPKWKIGATSGYDFDQKKISYTQLNVTRNLHCWALSFNWIPDGFRKSFSFTLRANSSTLQDLKVSKNRLWSDQVY